MFAAIKQAVTIQSTGTVEVHSPELRAGARAEAMVLIEGDEHPQSGSPLEALDALQASLQLTQSAAADWVQQARDHRQAFGQRRRPFPGFDRKRLDPTPPGSVRYQLQGRIYGDA